MLTILWRPVVNALTTPKSYRIQPVPRSTDGYAATAQHGTQSIAARLESTPAAIK